MTKTSHSALPWWEGRRAWWGHSVEFWEFGASGCFLYNMSDITPSDTSEELTIADNRRATKYTRKELGMRVLWGGGKVAFRLSPRPLFGFRRWLLRLFGAKVGRNVNVYPDAVVYFPWNLEIGDWSSIGEGALVYNLGPVKIGKSATISQRAHLCAGTHDYTDPAMPLIKPPIEIGDQVWICADAFVGPNLVVGDGAVVGARAVVTRSVEPWKVVAGNPARPVKDRILKGGSPHADE